MQAIHPRLYTLAVPSASRLLPDLPGWRVVDLAGRLVELSGLRSTAHLTAAFGLVLDAQLCGDRAAWITSEQSAFFPPDVDAGGVDLESLPVVRVPNVRTAGRAVEHLVRSGGFGLVVVDLSGEPLYEGHALHEASLPVPLLTRLLGLARTHHVAVLILTRKSADAASLNSLIALRAEAQWVACEGTYEVHVRVLKDKRHAPGWDHRERCRGSVGMY